MICPMFSAILDWLTKYQAVAIWLEGIGLVGIFIWDRIDARDQHKETLEQHAIWRKQIHADRVAGVFQAMRNFLFMVSDGIQYDSFGVGQKFEYSDTEDHYGDAQPMKELIAIHEAHHLAILINEPLAAYIGARVAEAVALQGVDDHAEFNKRLSVFWQNWEGEEMAEALRELS
jgi:hypothetical protein